MREMAKPIPVLIGSEYREKKTMKKQVKEKTAGIIIGTCEREKYRDNKILKVWCSERAINCMCFSVETVCTV